MTTDSHKRTIKFAEAILEATDQAMDLDPNVYLMGLGVPDPKGIFGTTSGLLEKYGKERVLDMPTSENGMTGVAIGTAIMGFRPIMTHQRVDFFLLALDQLINNAAKWSYMFGGQMHVPLIVRLIIGRGWGQGPQHSQSLHSLFAHIPGLVVVAPATPYDAKGLLVEACQQNRPVVYLEHRWLHNTHGVVPQEYYRVPFGKARVVQEGRDLTVVASSHMTIEALYAAKQLQETFGISVEVVDLRSLKPLDTETIFASVAKTKKVIIADADWKMAGFAAEISAQIVENCWNILEAPPERITYPDAITPTCWTLSNFYYPCKRDIMRAALMMMGNGDAAQQLHAQTVQERREQPFDVPDATFTGPF